MATRNNMFVCASCGKGIDGTLNAATQRWEPASRYWQGLDISEAYCSAQCGLNAYTYTPDEKIGPEP